MALKRNSSLLCFLGTSTLVAFIAFFLPPGHAKQPADVGFIDRTGKFLITLPGLEDGGEFHEGLAPVAVRFREPEKPPGSQPVSPLRWGFVDQNARVIITPKYLEARNFSQGLAAVLMADGQYAYVDHAGHEQIKLHASGVGDFHDGLAMIDQNDLRGYINRAGQFVIPPHLSDGYGNGALNYSEKLIAAQEPSTKPSEEGLFSYVDITGTEVIGPPRFADAGDFSEGLAPVELNGEENSGWGFIDKAGKTVIQPKYWGAHSFSEGLAAIEVTDLEWSYIDHSGKQLRQRFNEAGDFSEGLAAAGFFDPPPVPGKPFLHIDGRGLRMGYIDKSGKWVISPEFKKARKFSDGMAFVSRLPERFDFKLQQTAKDADFTR